MKRRSSFVLVLGLIVAVLLRVIFSRTPEQKKAVSTAVTEPSRVTSPAAPSVPDIAVVEMKPETTPDSSSAEIPEIEGSWIKLLRELKELAAVAPDAALARVAGMPDKHERKTAARAVCLVIADRDAAKAMLAAWNNDLGKFTDEATENIAVEKLARQWAETDLVRAFVWASALPADDEARRDRVMKGIASALAQVAPAEAAAMIAKHIHPDSAVHIDAAIEVLRTWAAQEYSGAMAWAALFPDGALRERGIEELANLTPGQPPSENKTN
ncbi:MAG TPA: hypothetical protein VHO24_20865 [Opitutaceae bacterium]|nr:hypothetical protein [Opitutaceae bacterium]